MITVPATGIKSLTYDDEKSTLTVVGDVDVVVIVDALRKAKHPAEVVSVTDEKKEAEEKKKKEEEEKKKKAEEEAKKKKEEEELRKKLCPYPYPPPPPCSGACCRGPSPPMFLCEPEQPAGCHIM